MTPLQRRRTDCHSDCATCCCYTEQTGARSRLVDAPALTPLMQTCKTHAQYRHTGKNVGRIHRVDIACARTNRSTQPFNQSSRPGPGSTGPAADSPGLGPRAKCSKGELVSSASCFSVRSGRRHVRCTWLTEIRH